MNFDAPLSFDEEKEISKRFKKYSRVMSEDLEEVLPNHYNSNWTIGDFIKEQNLGFFEGNIIKYVCRYKRKGGLDDLEKLLCILTNLLNMFQMHKKNEMTLDEYQSWTRTTAIYPKVFAIDYCTLGLCSESGEVAGKVKKWIRDKAPLNDLKAELGDVLWYLTRLSDECGWNLQEIMEENRDKLEDRKSRNKLSGSGDKR